jgi:hypothetical protein
MGERQEKRREFDESLSSGNGVFVDGLSMTTFTKLMIALVGGSFLFAIACLMIFLYFAATAPPAKLDKPQAKIPAVEPKVTVKKTPSIFSVGETATLQFLCFAAIDDGSWDEMVKAQTAKDNVGLADLLVTGRIFRLQQGDEVLVIDKGFTSYRVRSRGAKTGGRAGWIYRECLHGEDAN